MTTDDSIKYPKSIIVWYNSDFNTYEGVASEEADLSGDTFAEYKFVGLVKIKRTIIRESNHETKPAKPSNRTRRQS